MHDKSFHPSVTLIAGVSGHTVMHISNAHQAARMLLDAWPTDSAKAQLARRTCIEVLGGSGSAILARKTFEAAAREAGFLSVGDASRIKKPRASSKLAQREARRTEIDEGARQAISREVADREAKTARLKALRTQRL